MKTLVFDNNCFPPQMKLFENGQLIGQKEIDSIEEELFKILDSTGSPFEVTKKKRLLKKAMDIFKYSTIRIEENVTQ